MKPAVLVLENGAIFHGVSFGAPDPTYGEVVFTTSMTGYQEILTDPSYAGQIVVLTYPLIGNYGVNTDDWESVRIQARALVVREVCDVPSHWRATMSLDTFLASQGIPGIAGIDTRALTRLLRTHGVMMGAISTELAPDEVLAELRRSPTYGSVNFVEQVSTDEAYAWRGRPSSPAPLPETGDAQSTQPVPDPVGRGLVPRLAPGELPGTSPGATANRSSGLNVHHPSEGEGHLPLLMGEGRGEGRRYRIVVLDLGLKYNILRSLERFGCDVTAVPVETDAEDILALNPDGILLSPGPGDPTLLDRPVATVRRLLGQKPIMGICLGHQMLARALGATTFKLKFGHHGGNHPVKDLATGRVYITSQNHGYAIDGDKLRDGAEVSHLSLNDFTCEGLRHRSLPILSIQYHSEAAPGPRDNMYLFERFLELVGQDR